MTLRTDQRSGVACCGNCGSELAVICTGGCAEPDIVPRENYIAAMRKPNWPEKSSPEPVRRNGKLVKYPPPTHCHCGAPVVKLERPGRGGGRPPTHCEKHMKRKKVLAIDWRPQQPDD